MSEGQVPSLQVPGIPLLPGIGPKPGTPRGGLPYIWCTWLTRLLANENQCLWAPFFKARHKYEKVPDPTFNLAMWSEDHTALCRRVAADLKANGWDVRIENQNKFLIKGKNALLSGKPDILAFRGNEVRIIDGKSGSQKNSDAWQVWVYLFAVPMAFADDCRGKVVSGAVAYKTPSGEPRIVAVEPLTADRRSEIVKLLHSIGSEGIEPPKTPSQQECGFCDLGAWDCDKRFGEGAGVDIFCSEF